MHTNYAQAEQNDELADEDLVAKVLGGDKATFEILVRRHNRRLFRAARSIVNTDNEAEDVMQQAYVSAYTHLAQFDKRAKFSTWLTRIAINEALNRARKQSRRAAVEPDDQTLAEAVPQPASNPEHAAFLREVTVIVEAAVGQLPAGCREVFMLRMVEGLDTAETANALTVTEEVVKTRLSRARAMLRRHFRDVTEMEARSIFTFGGARCNRVAAAVQAQIAVL